MPTSEALLAHVDKIYDAALDPARWPETLAELAQMFGGMGAILQLKLNDRPGLAFCAAAGLPEISLEAYDRHYVNIDPRQVVALRLPWGSVMHDAMIMSEAAMDRNEYYTDFLGPTGLRYHVSGVLNSSAGPAAISVQRTRTAGPIGADAMAAFKPLVPHYDRALKLQRLLDAAQRREAALLDALDRLATGILLLDTQGRVLLANRIAAELLRQRDGLQDSPDGLQASRPVDTQALHRLLRQSRRRDLDAAGSVHLQRPSGKRALVATAAALGPAGPAHLGVDRASVMLIVADPERASGPSQSQLAQLFGLSRGEAALAAALASGKSLREAAAAFGVSHETVRKRLRRLFDKLEVSRQADLIRLLARYPAPHRD